MNVPKWVFIAAGAVVAVLVICFVAWWVFGRGQAASQAQPTTLAEQIKAAKAEIAKAKEEKAQEEELAALQDELAGLKGESQPPVDEPTVPAQQPATATAPALPAPALPAPAPSEPTQQPAQVAQVQVAAIPLSPQEEREYGVGDRLAVNSGNPSAILPETGLLFGNAADIEAQRKLELVRFQERRETLRMKMEYEKAKEQAKFLEGEKARVEREVETVKKSGLLPGDPLTMRRLDEEARSKVASIDQQLMEINAKLKAAASALNTSPAKAENTPPLPEQQ